jgi:hypothetical protein
VYSLINDIRLAIRDVFIAVSYNITKNLMINDLKQLSGNNIRRVFNPILSRENI